ncbi:MULTISPECIES: MerR family transcriptional regulator [Staphylococcaceae]|uniref:hypothetical protein n=1 Tax=Staphylococcaceae TaxID=90964 RepID=UPI000853B8F5|nr:MULTISPECIES: hypothetical protein [Staphylococcaceae]OEK73324.1 hypothetical protein AST05_12965 [Staphylococcus equorum]
MYTTKEFKTFHNIKLLQSLGLSLKEIKEGFEKPGYSFEKMIEVKEKVLIKRIYTIEYSLEMIERIKSMKNNEQNKAIDTEILMLLMNSMLFEEVQEIYSGSVTRKRLSIKSS